MKLASMLISHYKNILCPVYCMRQTAHNTLTIQTPRHYFVIPRPDGKHVNFVTFIVSLLSTAAPRLIAPTIFYALYPLTRPKSVW